jgi:hypothetical protein
MRLYVLALILAAHSGDPRALSDAQILERAQGAFRDGVQAREQPEKARLLFRMVGDDYALLFSRGIQNAGLLRNEGNAYLLAGDVPRAILAYRRGLRLAPGDWRLRTGLTAAREQVIYTDAGMLGRPLPEQRPEWLPWIAPGWRLFLILCFFTLACIASMRWRMRGQNRWLRIALAAGLVAFLLTLHLAMDLKATQEEERHPIAVLAEDGVRLRTGNGLAYPPRYESALNRGVEARVLFVRGDWLQIELSGGEVGWIPSSSALADTSGG